MRLARSVAKEALRFFMVGTIVAVTLLFLWRCLFDQYLLPLSDFEREQLRHVTGIVWPTVHWIRTVKNGEGMDVQVMIYLRSVLANGLLYGLLGSLVGAVRGSLPKPRPTQP
jgi:ABC-type dipeptide/oligopeptide/nickel transport system permease subunit